MTAELATEPAGGGNEFRAATHTRSPTDEFGERNNATRVRSTRINIPIIVVTACANNDRIAKAEQVGADAVLLKPCLPDTLLHEVQHAIDAKV